MTTPQHRANKTEEANKPNTRNEQKTIYRNSNK